MLGVENMHTRIYCVNPYLMMYILLGIYLWLWYVCLVGVGSEVGCGVVVVLIDIVMFECS